MAALRFYGYRSDNRYIVFQALTHTLNWPPEKWRQLDAAHRARNLAEYEGYMEVELSQVKDLIKTVEELVRDVEVLVASNQNLRLEAC